MSLGTYKHSKRKTKAASWRQEGSRLVPKWPKDPRGLNVRVSVERGPYPQGGFYARACVGNPRAFLGIRHGRKFPRACSTQQFSSSPTLAVKRALSNLARGLR